MTTLLVTNDDGVDSRGLAALRRSLAALGEVFVVAPDRERSAAGHAITTTTPLRVSEYRDPLGEFSGHTVNGTPADAVKLALGAIHAERSFDLVVSGVNLGQNTGTSIIYSGTVSAATEARILGVPSFAVSLDAPKPGDFEVACRIAVDLAGLILDQGLPERVLLNVNVPDLPWHKIRGVKVTRQGQSGFEESFQIRSDPRLEPYYWLAGAFRMTDVAQDTDAFAVDQGYISITPVTYDLTSFSSLGPLQGWLPRLTQNWGA